jgi:hypothetical protein
MDKKQKMQVAAINSSELLKAISQRDVEKVRDLLETAAVRLANKPDTTQLKWSPLKWNNYFYETRRKLALNETEKKNMERLDDEIESILLEHGAKNEFNESIKPDYFSSLARGRRVKKSRKTRNAKKSKKNKKTHKKGKGGSSTKRRKHIKK